MSQITAFTIILIWLGSFAASQIPQPVAMKTDNFNTLELRNYLLKPTKFEPFHDLFNEQFVAPMNDLGGHTLGQFRIEGEPDRFVWMRGFENMQTRVKFLNDFYFASPSWKKYRTDANGMIVNSDNVYLLKPLPKDGNLSGRSSVAKNGLEKKKSVVVVDLYVCNSSLARVIELFKNKYLPHLNGSGVSDTSLWVSEMAENDFPQLPVFQDKNLLAMMTAFQTEDEYRSKIKQVDDPGPELKNKMLELITTRSRWVLYSTTQKLK
jgi:hypothetical protein